MSERKWTPGPWVAFTGAAWPEQIGCCPLVGRPFSIAGLDNRNVAAASTREIAHLIAAAPDLYEALEQARDTILGLINARNSEAEGSDEDWVGGINAALAKARGEA